MRPLFPSKTKYYSSARYRQGPSIGTRSRAEERPQPVQVGTRIAAFLQSMQRLRDSVGFAA